MRYSTAMTNARSISNLLTVFIFLLPTGVSAQVVISEVMYDLAEGGDTGREWIEVFNSGGSAIDLTAWKLFEANTNHGITEISGGSSLASGAYAIIADNAANFLTDHPSYSGQVFDSAFSLNNTGEPLVLRDAELADKDTVSYTSAMGAAGDGNSLHRVSISGTTLEPKPPTPGTGSLTASPGGEEENTTTETQTTQVTTQAVGGSYPTEPQIIAYAGKDRTVIVGADTIFKGKAFTKDGEPLGPAGVRFLWNFGDGKTSEGYLVLHRFAHAGRYVVTLDVSSSRDSGAYRIIVTAKPAELLLSYLDDGSAVIENKTDFELDLSFWNVRSGERLFSIPEDTVILTKEKIIIPPASLGFSVGTGWSLLYPNGEVVDSAAPPKPTIMHAPAEQEQAPSKTSTVVYTSTTPKQTEEEATTTQVAAVVAVAPDIAVEPDGNDWLNTWTIGFIALTCIGAGGAFVVTRANSKEWDIIEE